MIVMALHSSLGRQAAYAWRNAGSVATSSLPLGSSIETPHRSLHSAKPRSGSPPASRPSGHAWGEIGPPKSRAGHRTIPIPPELVIELMAWKLRCRGSKLGLVFPSAAGTPIRHNNLLRRTYFPLQVRAGLGIPHLDRNGNPKLDADGNPMLTGKYGFHALRHAAASGWIESRIDLKRLQVWIGHENIQLTLDTYGHLLVDQDRDAELALKASRDLFGEADATPVQHEA